MNTIFAIKNTYSASTSPQNRADKRTPGKTVFSAYPTKPPQPSHRHAQTMMPFTEFLSTTTGMNMKALLRLIGKHTKLSLFHDKPKQLPRKPYALPRESQEPARCPHKRQPLPNDWQADICAAISEALNEEQARWQEKKFRDYWHAKNDKEALKVDWQAT